MADYYSRPNDTGDIDYETFCTVDRIADDKNTKLKRFNSKYYCPNTEAVNAFSVNWQGELNWLCPPIHLIGGTIKHVNAKPAVY